jgi:hypothetical protein
VEELQRRARENWKAYRAQDPNAGLSVEEQQRQARERWKEYTQSKGAAADRGAEAAPDKERTQERDKAADHGIEDDFGP